MNPWEGIDLEKDLIPGADAFANLSTSLQSLGDQPFVQILECNETTRDFGLTITPDEAQSLVESRADALNRTGRIEFGPCVTQKIILKFCDSPYLTQDAFAGTMSELTQIFYFFKNELEWMPDDELIRRMRTYYDTDCRGSIENLNHVLESLVHSLRFGTGDDVDLSSGRKSFTMEEDEDA